MNAAQRRHAARQAAAQHAALYMHRVDPAQLAAHEVPEPTATKAPKTSTTRAEFWRRVVLPTAFSMTALLIALAVAVATS